MKAGFTHRRARRCGVAVVSVVVAFGVRYWMSKVLGEELPFTLFVAAALVAAWYGGAATGIVALLLGLLVADYFFVGRPRGFGAGDADSWVRIVRYLFTASLGIGLIEVLHRARRRTEAALQEAQAEAERRRQSEIELRQAHELLTEHAAQLDQRIEERTAELRANVNSLQEILYNIAHCLRAPIRASASFSHILVEQYGPQLDERAQEYVCRVRAAAERMEALTRDLLAYGDVAQKILTLEGVDLKAVVTKAIARLRSQSGKTEAEITLDGALPRVRGHADTLEQVVIELLDNAIKFGKPGAKPKIRISAERWGRGARLWVEDNGIGIDPRFLEKIFGVFEQIDPSAYAAGTGIGLAIVKKGMQRQGGEAGVESEPGAGSRFWLEFPTVLRESGGPAIPEATKVFSA